MAHTVEIKRSSCTCEFCDKEKPNCFEFCVTDEKGKIIRCVKQCADCLESLFVRVVSLLPVVTAIEFIIRSYSLIRLGDNWP